MFDMLDMLGEDMLLDMLDMLGEDMLLDMLDMLGEKLHGDMGPTEATVFFLAGVVS
jgi:hypothetical protein